MAGETTDRVVETAWGPSLGRVIEKGPSLAFTGIPRSIAGHAGERHVRAPSEGRMHGSAALGSPVRLGAELGHVGDAVVEASLDGVLVGLTRSGVAVHAGAKIAEVDPRGDRGLAFGIGERAAAVARGVIAIVAPRTEAAA